MNRTVILTPNRMMKLVEELTKQGIPLEYEALTSYEDGSHGYYIHARLSPMQEDLLDSTLMTIRCMDINTQALNLKGGNVRDYSPEDSDGNASCD